MASRPGVLTEWPWSPLGGFKFLVAPLAIASIHSYVTAEEEEKDLWRLMIVAMMLWRIFTARYGSVCRVTRRTREGRRSWISLHHHFLYSRYHSHHHSSIVTEPITSVVHPFAEHIAYSVLFAIPIVTASLCGILSIVPFVAYVTYIDFMNYMGHYNFEFFPKRLFHHSLSSSSSATPPRSTRSITRNLEPTTLCSFQSTTISTERPTNAASPCTRSRWRERRNHPTSSTSLTSLHSTPSTKCALASRPSHLVPCGLDPHGTSPTSCGPSLSSSLSSP
ncbi:hypothetical protein ISN45_At05g026880 [Arabidopsis thaliana x Arabidopsis arenosa]|uniref:Fatty acid hydroxylase domain-containing protein n=1 Tax=Arabidopsis thaliana x Arabidopsis arenosa TaxID=1240361 RepID=A0A8T2CZK4_9BRAS|nr:hypothetical protein ISN45_At05g026880 [Arabidopsis thaliana x Arabidopsis arenosa]